MSHFMKLFEPISIGPLRIKNRIMMASMAVNYANRDGTVSPRNINYYVERAKGGAGLITIEWVYAQNHVKETSFQLGLDSDDKIPGLSKLVEIVRSYDAAVAIQIAHPGRQSGKLTGGKAPADTEYLSPSAIANRMYPALVPKEMTLQQIEQTIDNFAQAALRAKKAGFDAVEFHAAHGYLLSSFMSPYCNKRNDTYGGNFQGRMRMPLELIERAKEKVGSGFPFWLRMNGDDCVEGGLEIEEAKKAARLFEDAGVYAVHVSGGVMDCIVYPRNPAQDVGEMSSYYHHPRETGYLVHLAEQIKKVVSVPVIAVGGINDPRIADEILIHGQADMIAMARPLLTDPELPRKAAEGRLEDIRKCMQCNDGCIRAIWEDKPVICSINPECGREGEYRIEQVQEKKNILIIGGGPAGMEAARVAKLRGHNVVLCEKNDKLGGALLEATVPDFKSSLRSTLTWFTHQMKALDIDVRLSTEVTLDLAREMNPNVILVATGGVPRKPKLPGVEKKNCFYYNEVLLNKAKVGDTVIIMGGGLVGCDTACYLAEQGKKVTVVTVRPYCDMCGDMDFYSRTFLLRRLSLDGVSIINDVDIQEITDDGILIVQGGEKKHLEAETMVTSSHCNTRRYCSSDCLMACVRLPNLDLKLSLERKLPNVKVYGVGDCVRPRLLTFAVHEGARIARLI